jgi:hypothetical protein
LQLELLNLDRDLLALAAEHHAAKLFDDQFQMFDLLRLRRESLNMDIMPLDDQHL